MKRTFKTVTILGTDEKFACLAIAKDDNSHQQILKASCLTMLGADAFGSVQNVPDAIICSQHIPVGRPIKSSFLLYQLAQAPRLGRLISGHLPRQDSPATEQAMCCYFS